jgi:hypothetical protein
MKSSSANVNWGLPEDQKFFVADSVRELFAARLRPPAAQACQVEQAFCGYTQQAYPEKAASLGNAASSGACPLILANVCRSLM